MSALAGIDGWTLVACIAALVAGGLVKGMTAIGLPLVAVPVLATVLPVPQALALVVLPSMATSLWQAIQGGHYRAALARLAPVLATLVAGMAASVHVLARVEPQHLNLALGVVVIAFGLLLVKQVVFTVRREHERIAGAVTGLVAGLVGGVSLFVGPIFAMYLSGLGLDRNVFVSTMAIANLTGAVTLALFIASYGVVDGGDFALSAAATVIVFVGLFAGSRIRLRVSEARFRQAVALVLLASGANLVRRALVG